MARKSLITPHSVSSDGQQLQVAVASSPLALEKKSFLGIYNLPGLEKKIFSEIKVLVNLYPGGGEGS